MVITGASRGLGAGLARSYAERGLRLGLCSRTSPVLPESPTVHSATIDVCDAEAVDRFSAGVAERFGRIDAWINNAGVLEPIAPLRDIDADAFSRHLSINVQGVFNGSRSYIRHLWAIDQPGVLINLSSGAGRKPYAGWSAYCASKAAVDRMTECIAVEEAERGLRAYSVAPGVIDTAMQELIRGCDRDQFPEVERFREMKRTGAFNTPEFVGECLLELAFESKHTGEEVLIRLPTEGG